MSSVENRFRSKFNLHAGDPALAALWRGLRRLGILLIVGSVALLLLICGVLLPQLPDQLRGDPATAARWLAGVSANYGVSGELLRVLGLFNVLHGLPLQIILSLLSLILLVHLGESLAQTWFYRQLPKVIHRAPPQSTLPIALPAAQPLYRQRWAAPRPPDQVAVQLAGRLATHFEQLIQQPDAPQTPTEASPHPAKDERPAQQWLAIRHARWVQMRPALMLGLLLAVGVVWWIVISGWEITAPVLAPGERYHYAARELQLAYETPRQAEQAPQLVVHIGPAEGRSEFRGPLALRVGGVTVWGAASAPSLLISTADGKPGLALAGQSETTPSLGLIFPSSGSEQSIILPAAAIGLRIVRLAESNAATNTPVYLVEVYAGENSQLTKRIELGENPVERLTLDAEAGAADAAVTLEIMALPSLAVTVRSLPGAWLLWLALALVALGGVGYVRRPAFLLAQVGPWPVSRSVVILQSDDQRLLTQVAAELTASSEDAAA